MTDGTRGRCAVVANPVKVSDGFRGAVTEALRESGWAEPLWLETSENDPGRSMTATAVAEEVDLVIAAGGDGTVRVVADGLAGTGIPMGIVPEGTANLLSRNLDIPQNELEAIKVALRGFPSGPGAKLIVLITDGDDQDPYSEEAAKAARDAGVKIVTVGLGDSEKGSEITITDPQTGARTTLMHEGKPVISKLNAEQLRKIALVTEGAYIPAGTSAIDLDAIMESHVRPIIAAAAESAERPVPAEKYPWLVLLSLVSLLAALWVGSSMDRRAA